MFNPYPRGLDISQIQNNLHFRSARGKPESSILQLPIGDFEAKCEHSILSLSDLTMWKHDQVPRNY